MFGFPAPIRKSSFVPLGHFVSDFSAHKSELSVRGAVCPCDKQLLNKLWLFLTIARKLKTQGVCLVLRHPIFLNQQIFQRLFRFFTWFWCEPTSKQKCLSTGGKSRSWYKDRNAKCLQGNVEVSSVFKGGVCAVLGFLLLYLKQLQPELFFFPVLSENICFCTWQAASQIWLAPTEEPKN